MECGHNPVFHLGNISVQTWGILDIHAVYLPIVTFWHKPVQYRCSNRFMTASDTLCQHLTRSVPTFDTSVNIWQHQCQHVTHLCQHLTPQPGFPPVWNRFRYGCGWVGPRLMARVWLKLGFKPVSNRFPSQDVTSWHARVTFWHNPDFHWF